MATCYLCTNPLTEENASKEHIILNSIGGMLISKQLLCITCNSKLGDSMDAELYKQLHLIATMLNVERDREEHYPVKGITASDGKKYDLLQGGKPKIANPSIKTEVIDGKVKITAEARTSGEMDRILKSLIKEHPGFDLEAAKIHYQNKEEYLTTPLRKSTTLGGEPAFKSVCKTAINAYLHFGGKIEFISHLIPYLKGKSENSPVRLYCPNKSPYQIGDKEVLHTIIIKGNSKEKILYAFVEFFSGYSFLVILNENYEGDEVLKTYFYHLLEGKEISKEIDFDLSREALLAITNLDLDPHVIARKISRVMSIADERQLIEAGIAQFFKAHNNTIGKLNLKEGEEIPKEAKDAFVHELIDRLTRLKDHYENKYKKTHQE